jgi:hypothetical protein
MGEMFSLPDALKRKLLFVHGKGGVGKTLFSKALAEVLADQKGSRPDENDVLLVQIDDPSDQNLRIQNHSNGVATLNATVKECFLEYAGLKLNSAGLARFLLDHKLINYLVEAAPGMKELAIVGKIWYETRNYSTVIVDMPSTGHALTFFEAFRNWADLFENSPIARDSIKIEADFSRADFCAHLLLALPEEMPLTESNELRSALERLYPGFASSFIINRVTPGQSSGAPLPESDRPFSATAQEHFEKRRRLEAGHLKTVAHLKPHLLPQFIPSSDLIPEMKNEIRKILTEGTTL